MMVRLIKVHARHGLDPSVEGSYVAPCHQGPTTAGGYPANKNTPFYRHRLEALTATRFALYLEASMSEVRFAPCPYVQLDVGSHVGAHVETHVVD